MKKWPEEIKDKTSKQKTTNTTTTKTNFFYYSEDQLLRVKQIQRSHMLVSVKAKQSGTESQI
jgi:hypothetical protein